MHPSIAGYDVEQQIESLFASSLYQARHADSGRPAIIKTLNAAFPDLRDIKRLEREYWVLKDFEGVAGVLPVRELQFHGNGSPAIVSDSTGQTLAYYLREGSEADWPVDRIVTLAIQLVETIDSVHARNTVHKNIAPHNILLDVETWTVRLMNFEIATVLSREHQDRSLSKRLEGSLPYISPEQTGRMSRDLDHRSDFYSLGVVLYRLLFRRLPFEARSNLEWVHCHIGKLPQVPENARARVPEPLVDIVMRLLAKSPEDRYQSCFGLLHDLRQCQRQLTEHGSITTFELATQDVSEVFRIPQVLYGRQAELDRLMELFGRVEQGSFEICVISGPSGVGKSALVDELNRPIVRARGYFLRGKFDQFERATPYAAISAAFTGLVHELLTEPADRLAYWKDAITDTLGPNAQILIDVVPDFERIIGSQPPVPALPPTEAQNRLHLTFQKLVGLLARCERPMILYLDDLQWSDGPTLNLIQKLATARDITHFLMLGAYRSDEVDGTHLLGLTRNEIAKTRTVHTLELTPLDRKAVTQMVADALRSDTGRVTDLADVLYNKTEGNPFFVNELMTSLVDDGLIRFDRSQGRWTWSVDAVRKAEIGDNVVRFLIGNLEKLPEETREALKFAACIGHEFDLRKLSVVHQRPMAELGRAMMRALERNVLIPLDEGYQYFDTAAAQGGGSSDAAANPRYRFQHDRLHQAAYELIGSDDRRRVHLSIGRLLEAEESDEPENERLLKIVRHLNEAQALMDDSAEREDLARMNLRAAAVAHDASAYDAALHHLETCRGLLRADAWQSQYDLAKDASALYAQTAYLTGLHTEADAELTSALAKVHTPLEKAQILAMRTRHYSTLGRMKDSIAAALDGLRLLDIDVGRDVPDAVVQVEIAAIDRNRAGRKIADLIHADRMTDPKVSAAVELLMEIFPAAFLSGAGNLFQFVVLKAVNLSLRHGNSAETAFAYAAYGMLLSGALNDPREGYRYGKLALAMNETFDDIGLKSRIIYVYGMFIHHWSNHWTTLTDWFRRGIEAGYQSGDLLYLAYNAQDCVIWDPTMDLETGIVEQTRFLEIVRECNYADSLDSGTLFLQMQLNFAGRTDGQFSLSNDDFDEEDCLKGMTARNFMTGVANYHIYKAEIHCLYGDFQGALPHVRAQEALMDSVMSLPQVARYRFIAHQAYAALCPQLTRVERARARERMAEHEAQMTLWAENCPQNFRHLHLAMTGECARIDGDLVFALKSFEQAAHSARENGFIRDEAVIHERTAATFEAMGLASAATSQLAAARYLYYRWGAARKVAQLEESHPALKAAAEDASGPTARITPEDGSGAVTQESLDLASVMDAARAISGEIVLPRLLARTMTILLESTGAQRGVFLTRDGERYRIEVECFVQESETKVLDSNADEAGPASVPLSIVNYALRTRSPLVLNDALNDAQFDNDSYLAARRARSIICVPIVRAEKFEGIIYLENNLTPDAFPEARVAIVELLAAQAAISIENARLYVDLEHKVEERTIELSRKTTALETVANQLSKYLSPQVYRSIFDHQKEVRVASERKRLTVFFSDLVGFTETADRMESEDLTQLLNQYLSEMADIALTYGATIDKFVGDAIVIFFGDPETRGVQQDALACVKMAIAMRARLAELRQEWLDQGIEKPLECRMGIHTGYCTVGNFGSETRMDYTIIGGAVNLASRLEAAAEPGAILISHDTYAQVKSRIQCASHKTMTVRGIAHPVQTYKVVDLIENLARGSMPIHEEDPHLVLTVDPSRMSVEERRAAAEKLRQAAARLESPARIEPDVQPEVPEDPKRLN